MKLRLFWVTAALFKFLIIVLLSLSTIPCGYMGVIEVSVSDTPGHHCKVLSINYTPKVTDVELPFQQRSTWIGPDSCSRYKLSGNWTGTVGCSNDTEQCLHGCVYSTERYTATIVPEVIYTFAE